MDNALRDKHKYTFAMLIVSLSTLQWYLFLYSAAKGARAEPLRLL